jgi:hypothetical protein
MSAGALWCRHVMRPHQKVIIIEQYGAGTFMVPSGAPARWALWRVPQFALPIWLHARSSS